jgi:four helix bundle protein
MCTKLRSNSSATPARPPPRSPKDTLPWGNQLRRATTSICLNIAEGAGEFSAKEKAPFYRIAKRAATECAAILDVVGIWAVGGSADENLSQRLDRGED